MFRSQQRNRIGRRESVASRLQQCAQVGGERRSVGRDTHKYVHTYVHTYIHMHQLLLLLLAARTLLLSTRNPCHRLFRTQCSRSRRGECPTQPQLIITPSHSASKARLYKTDITFLRLALHLPSCYRASYACRHATTHSQHSSSSFAMIIARGDFSFISRSPPRSPFGHCIHHHHHRNALRALVFGCFP